jgi:hypothetical protein
MRGEDARMQRGGVGPRIPLASSLPLHHTCLVERYRGVGCGYTTDHGIGRHVTAPPSPTRVDAGGVGRAVRSTVRKGVGMWRHPVGPEHGRRHCLMVQGSARAGAGHDRMGPIPTRFPYLDSSTAGDWRVIGVGIGPNAQAVAELRLGG